ncbi:MAG TPA: hypothetical protein VLA88_05820 [Candidatus Saccharimonadales bacterium]|nr:hypothetical protein [Candidatus Saccharimonadales bacterium]
MPNRLKPRQRPVMLPPPPSDDEIRRMLASQLVGMRIVGGFSVWQVYDKMGLRPWRRRVRWYHGLWHWAMAWYKVPRAVRKLEREMGEARLSTLQRYSRVVDRRLEVTISRKRVPPLQTLQQRAAAIKRRKRLAAGWRPRRNPATY